MFSFTKFDFVLFSAILLCIVKESLLQEVYGCGGFVQSTVQIEFAKVEVRLYTKQGNLKYQTDCAAINGYYMIPVYDKGDYILKVEPPTGWTFEPRQYDLEIDGESDSCSQGKDLNFQFTGFGIQGTVISQGSNKGPAGVTVTVTKKGSTDVVQSVQTDETGNYIVEKILPGDYQVKASQKNLIFLKDSTTVKVSTQTAKAEENLVVAGYKVWGKVSSDKEPIQGVQFVLYSEEIKEVNHCTKDGLKKLEVSRGSSPLCYVTSQSNGEFVFQALPSGNYWVVPRYQNDNIRFDVRPTEEKFVVKHETLEITTPFTVAGFSVSGRVAISPKGRGVASATIKLDNKAVTQTKADGSFILESVTAGTYTIDVDLPGNQLYFDPTTLRITAQTPVLPEIYASRFAACGSVELTKASESDSGSLSSLQVLVKEKDHSNKQRHLSLNKQGKFCTDLPPGNYVFRVDIPDEYVKKGLALYPQEQKVKVDNSPTDLILFKQLLLSIGGSVSCLEACRPMQLALHALDRNQERVLGQLKTDGKKGTYLFTDLLPGRYRVDTLLDEWCLKDKTLDVELTNKPVANINFEHTGYVMSVSLTHDAQMNYKLAAGSKDTHTKEVGKGLNTVCVKQPGLYHITLKSCHKFDQEMYTFDTAQPAVIVMVATQNLVSGKVYAQVSDSITILVSSNDQILATLGPLKLTESKEGATMYEFQHWANAGEILEVVPKSSKLLFYPEVLIVTVPTDSCLKTPLDFQGKEGLFIRGKVQPAIDGVTVTVTTTDGLALETATNTNGTYELGPLDPDGQYTTAAVKEGYQMTHDPKDPYSFQAFQLGQVEVQVIGESEQSLMGVLLSLSGQNFRNNSLTEDTGFVTFNNLNPGQYFLKPMMKEFQFSPDSQVIDVSEGSMTKVKLTGTRVAFSCYGIVTSLNGEPEAGVFVEAQGMPNEKHKQCGLFLEDGKTEMDGSFRIRGLQPQCSYAVRLRDQTYNPNIERSVPRAHLVRVEEGDKTGIRLLAMRQAATKQTDVIGFVECESKYLSSLKVSISREDTPENTLQTLALAGSRSFQFEPIPRDGKIYSVEIKNTLPLSAYNVRRGIFTFRANTSIAPVTLKFMPTFKSGEQDVSTASLMILPLALLVFLCLYNKDMILPMLSQMWESARTPVRAKVVHQPRAAPSSSAGTSLRDSSAHDAPSSTPPKKKKPKKA